MAKDLNLRFILLSLEGPALDQKFELNLDEVSIGSSGVIRLPDDGLQPIHALFVRQGSTYLVRRASPQATVFVNSREINEEVLNSMDEIRIGKHLLLFSIGEQPRDLSSFPTTKLSKRSRSSSNIVLEQIDPDCEEGDAVTRREFKTRRMETDEERGVAPLRGALPRVTLKVSQGGVEAASYDYQASQIVIGRTMGDCTIDDPDISRKHCSIEVHGRGRVYLHDHASTNGTFLNGSKISYSLLKSGDRITVGSTSIRILIS